MKPQSKDSYQPSERADHSKICTRIGEGSERRVAMAGWVDVWGRSERNDETEEELSEGRWLVGSAAPVRFVDVGVGRCGKSALISVSIVWRGSSGSQESIQNVVGV